MNGVDTINNEIWKSIQDFQGYYVSNLGNIKSTKYGYDRIIHPWLDSKGRYYMIGLSVDNVVYKKLVHRLVAEAFCYKPDESFEVNHKDKDTKNNCASNLEWVSHKDNLHQSYDTMSPVRNYRNCFLITPTGERIGFKTVKDLQKYIDENNLPCGKHAINYYGHSQGYSIEKM